MVIDEVLRLPLFEAIAVKLSFIPRLFQVFRDKKERIGRQSHKTELRSVLDQSCAARA